MVPFWRVRLAPCAIRMFFSAFATVTHGLLSSLCCGTCGFRGSQQFSLSPYGLPPYALRQLLVRRGPGLPLRFRSWVVVAVAFKQVDDSPYAKARAQRDDKGLQSGDSGCKKCHVFLPEPKPPERLVLPHRHNFRRAGIIYFGASVVPDLRISGSGFFSFLHFLVLVSR